MWQRLSQCTTIRTDWIAPPPCFHACAVQLLGRSGVEAAQLLGQPAIAPMGQHGHGGVEIDIESHCTRQTIDVQAMHAHPQPVLDAMASGVASDPGPRTLLGVVGPEQGRGLPSQSRDRSLAQRALVPWERHRRIQGPETLMTAVRRVEHRLAPCAGGECPPAAPVGGATPPAGDTPEAALGQLRQRRRGDDLGSKVPPLGSDAGEVLPQLDTLERRASLRTPGAMRVGRADDLARVLWGAAAQHPGPGLATRGEIGLVQPGSIAPKRERGQVQGAGVGWRTHHRRHGAAPARASLWLLVAHGARGGVGRGGWLRRPSEAHTQAHGLVAVQVVEVAAPVLVQQLQDEPAHQRPGRGHHRGARLAGVADQGLAVATGHQGQAEQHPRDARAQATSRSQAQGAHSGDDGRFWDGWGRGLRLPLGSPQGRLPKKGGVVRNIIMLLMLGAALHIISRLPSRYVWRIINPVGQLSRREHVNEVRAVAGHQDMLARNDHGGNHEVGIALPSAMLLAETFHHRRTGNVKYDDVKLGEHLLCVQQALVCEWCFGRQCLQGKLTPSAQHFSNHHGRECNLGPRHPQKIQA